MDFQIPEAAKKPEVLLIGLAVGVALLYFGSRGASTGSTTNATLASQQVATAADIQYSHDQTQQTQYALETRVAMAQIAAAVATNNANNNAELAANAIQSANTITIAASKNQLDSQQAMAGLIATLGAQKTSLILDRQREAYMLSAQAADIGARMALAPLAAQTNVTLAQISGDTAEQLATINAQAQETIAQANATVANNRINAGTTNDIISNAGQLAGAAASIASLF